jgi:hypothetical protein
MATASAENRSRNAVASSPRLPVALPSGFTGKREAASSNAEVKAGQFREQSEPLARGEPIRPHVCQITRLSADQGSGSTAEDGCRVRFIMRIRGDRLLRLMPAFDGRMHAGYALLAADRSVA